MTKKAEIYYFTLTDELPREDKLAWFKNARFTNIEFDKINPDDKGNWLNLTDNDFDGLMPVCDKEVKLGKKQEAIFKLFSLGVVTARDEWVYDDNKENLAKKVGFLIDIYNKDVDKHNGKSKENIRNSVNCSIKWTRAVKNDLEKGKKYIYDELKIVESLYRPFIKKYLYFSNELNEMQSLTESIFIANNICIVFTDTNSQKPFLTCVVNKIFDFHFVGAAAQTQCLPLYVYDKDNNPHDNITDWALSQFQNHYIRTASPLRTGSPEINKLDIFHYVYAVLHNPAYREKYEQNLKREFPRIPFYDDFAQWVEWGKQLMDLHLNYETVEKYPLKRLNTPPIVKPKAKLKADKINSVIQLDDNTSLSGIPLSAWEYKLGNRSALEWVLDQYKEKKPKDPTIAEKFNTYCFADYKEQVIELLMRVCTVSVETVKIIEAMKNRRE